MTADLTSLRDRLAQATGADREFLVAELRAACGYMLNAKIDLETGCPKATAICTIEGGIRRIRAAIAKAEGADPCQ